MCAPLALNRWGRTAPGAGACSDYPVGKWQVWAESFSLCQAVLPGLREKADWYLKWDHYSQRARGSRVAEPKKKAKLRGTLEAIKVANCPSGDQSSLFT